MVSDAVAILSNSLEFLHVNTAFAEATGYGLEALRGRMLEQTDYGRALLEGAPDLAEALRQGRDWRGEAASRAAWGEEFWQSLRCRRLAASGVDLVVLAGSDVTAQCQRQETEIVFSPDGLDLGLPLLLLMDRVEQAIARAVRQRKLCAVAVLRLTGGGGAELDVVRDALLDRLRGVLRRLDSLVRLDRDEAALVLEDFLEEATLGLVMERVRGALQQAETTITYLDGSAMAWRMGVAAFPLHGASAEEIHNLAHAAMLQADAATPLRFALAKAGQ